MKKNPNYPKEIIVGKVIGVRGIKCQLKIRSESDNPNRFTTNTEILIDNKKYTINKVNSDEKKQLIYINISNINDRNSAEKIIGELIKVPISSLPKLKDKNTYYYFQIIGLDVLDELNTKIGKVINIMPNVNNDNYIIKTSDNKEIIIPSKSEWVKKIDICNNVMNIVLPKYI